MRKARNFFGTLAVIAFMRICLITPPSVFLLDERVFLTLGILKVAACLEEKGHIVEMVDASGIEGFEDAVRDHAASSEAEVFGITATTPQMPAVAKIARVLRETKPSARLILGGPHVTLVCAALKREKKIGMNGRANRAFRQLEELFDVLVAGDGEDAVFLAIEPNAPKYIDADNPSLPLFMTNERLNETPWPARHLVDADSYHYTIEGRRSYSLIAQLGCLDGASLIDLASGVKLPIKDVQKGDLIRCYDVESEEFKTMPVQETWRRDADDLYELQWSDGTTLRVTGEHPIWTKEGWITVDRIACGQSAAKMRDVPKGISGIKVSKRSLLQLPLPRRLAENELQSSMAEEGAGRHAGQVEGDDPGATASIEQYRSSQGRGCHSAREENLFGHKKGEAESDETPGGCGESFSDSEKAVGQLFLGKDERQVEIRETENHMGEGSDERIAQRCGNRTPEDSGNRASDFQVCGQRGILDRPVQVREAPESRLYGSILQKGNSFARRILALARLQRHRSSGLREQGMVSARSLVQGVATERAREADQEAAFVWPKLIGKTFVGRAEVFNITVHPVHTYFANGMLVHNCPFACGFCGGRESPMLRRIRTRTTESIVSEVMHLNERYGADGIMFYDDELNVNQSMIELMEALSAAQEKRGIDLRLRGFIKSQLFTDAQAAAMYRAGFRWILVGFESGSPRILENINKKATRDENTRCVEIAKRHGLKVKALMSMGHPGEMEETVMQTRDWLLEVHPDDFDMTVITTYPGTPYYDHATRHPDRENVWTYTYPKTGDRLHSHEVNFIETADFYKGDPDGGYQSYVFTDFLKETDIVRLRDFVERDVRAKLNIPFNAGAAAIRYEHSMGQSGPLPGYILKTTQAA